jgi:hypothetical protein
MRVWHSDSTYNTGKNADRRDFAFLFCCDECSNDVGTERGTGAGDCKVLEMCHLCFVGEYREFVGCMSPGEQRAFIPEK